MIEHMIERTEPPFAAPERAMLDAWLDFHRATLARKCEGLTDEQLRLRSVPPSNLSLLGLVRHMAEVERGWFRQVLTDEEVPDIYVTDQDQDADFNAIADAAHDRGVRAPQRARRPAQGADRRSGRGLTGTSSGIGQG